MSDSGTLAVASLVGIGGMSLLPGVDMNAVVGAFAGAMFFVVYAKELSALARIGYFIASWIVGFYVASEFTARDWAETSGLCAFAGALLCVVIGTGVLDWAKGGAAPAWLKIALAWLRSLLGGAGGRNG
ncbi:putative phage holin [compost metagenome]